MDKALLTINVDALFVVLVPRLAERDAGRPERSGERRNRAGRAGMNGKNQPSGQSVPNNPRPAKPKTLGELIGKQCFRKTPARSFPRRD